MTSPTKRIKVLLDTDIGSDIDDAVCLAYLLAQPHCDLLGITTVTGDTVVRARLASVLCKVAGRTIPIFPGAAAPLLAPQMQPHVPQAAALRRWPHERDFPRHEAVRFLRETIRRHPGEIVLLTIGPLTNIGLLFATDPEIPGLLKGLVMMCGFFEHRAWHFGQVAEWNSRLDPHATAIVYRAAVGCHRSIGLDVTMSVSMPAAEVRRRFRHPLLRPVLDFAEVWFRTQHASQIIFHDPLAAVTVFDARTCGFARGRVDVELDSPRLAGYTHWRPDPAGPHEVAVTVNPRRFFDRYFAVFSVATQPKAHR